MKNTIKKAGKGLSIKELEERMELSVAANAELEVCKRCDGGGGGVDPEMDDPYLV